MGKQAPDSDIPYGLPVRGSAVIFRSGRYAGATGFCISDRCYRNKETGETFAFITIDYLVGHDGWFDVRCLRVLTWEEDPYERGDIEDYSIPMPPFGDPE